VLWRVTVIITVGEQACTGPQLSRSSNSSILYRGQCILCASLHTGRIRPVYNELFLFLHNMYEVQSQIHVLDRCELKLNSPSNFRSRHPVLNLINIRSVIMDIQHADRQNLPTDRTFYSFVQRTHKSLTVSTMYLEPQIFVFCISCTSRG
jgi:hypothetical protein